jgi:hypothetical protein|nr:MAG TPA: hypothetical protein [Caudoviricetes sp.]
MTNLKVKTLFNYVSISKKEEEKLLDVARKSNLVDTEIPYKHIYERVIRLINKYKRFLHRIEVNFDDSGKILISLNANVSLILSKKNVSLIINNDAPQTFFGINEELPIIERKIDEYFMKPRGQKDAISEEGLKLFHDKLAELEAFINKFSSISLMIDETSFITWYHVSVELDGYDALTLLKQKEHGGSSVVLLYNFWEETKDD